ncbi:VOC family protein [Saccharopolyspora indica]
MSDLDRSLTFYADAFGLREVGRAEMSDPNVEEAFLEDPSGARLLVLIRGDRYAVPVSHGWAPLAMVVSDIEQARADVENAGGRLAVQPKNLGPVTVFMAVDPDGYLVEVAAGDLSVLDDLEGQTSKGQRMPHPMPEIHEPY